VPDQVRDETKRAPSGGDVQERGLPAQTGGSTGRFALRSRSQTRRRPQGHRPTCWASWRRGHL